MCESLQDGYAKHLKHVGYGYPLRIPEPMGRLPQKYQESGLEIGDVGIVRDDGQFDVLFSVCKPSDHPLHESRGVPENFQPVEVGDFESNEGAVAPISLCSHGIEQVLQLESLSRPVRYEFKTSVPSGAVLILPNGATSTSLLSTDQFRDVAIKNAHHWCVFTNKFYGSEYHHRSLYLITGVYKASSWSLGSFNHIRVSTGGILAKRDDRNPSIYTLESSFLGDWRRCPTREANGTVNQTVFITGFRITVRSWLPDPVVEKITRPDSVWSVLAHQIMGCLRRIRGSLRERIPPSTISMEDSPQLSQPAHPSDIISYILLRGNPKAEVAITHDDQWMDMMKKGFEHEDLCDESQVKAYLTKHYTISLDSGSNNTVVLLQREECDTSAVPVDVLSEPNSVVSESPASGCKELPPPESPPPSPQLEILPPATLGFMSSLPPAPSVDDPQRVITYIRVENIRCGGKRIPAGFYVLVEFGDIRRRTQNKSTHLNDSCIEWDDEILLPSEMFNIARFIVYASFELNPVLGNGETLYTAEVHAKELVHGTHLIMLSSGESGTVAHAPSLLITLGQWYSDYLSVTSSGGDNNLDLEESSDLVHETELGQQAFLRYLNEYLREDLDNATQHFENAWCFCNSSHRCRAVVLVNFAMAKFMSYKIDPTSSNLDDVILLYQQALELRPPGHRDRLATVLQLAQTLLYRYEREGCDESVARKIDELMAELPDLSRDSHERRAADLIVETLHRCRIVNSGSLVQLNDLVEQLKRNATVPPDGYFDRPQRLVNLSIALWGYCEKHGKLEDLDDLVEVNKQALRLLPQGHPGRHPLIEVYVDALWRLCEIHGDFKYLNELDTLDAEALGSTLEQHFGRGDHTEKVLSPLDEKLLIRWTRVVLTRSSAQEALSAAVKLKIPRFLVYRVVCESLESVGHLLEAVECYGQMQNDLSGGGDIHDERTQWEHDFRERCVPKLESLGDIARDSNLDEALKAYSAALLLSPSNPRALINKWALIILTRGSMHKALDAASKFKVPRFLVYLIICDILEGEGRLWDAIECFQEMQNELTKNTEDHEEHRHWEFDFRVRCVEKLITLGDAAIESCKHDSVTGCLHLVLLKYSNEIVELDLSSHVGYKGRHIALRAMGRHKEAFEAFKMMLSKLQQSSNPDIRELYHQYIDPTMAIKKAVKEATRHMPHILIDTETGHLYNKVKQRAAFEELPIYDELRSSMTRPTELDQARIQKEVKDFYKYVMLSHKWQPYEPTLQMVEKGSVYELPASTENDKVQQFCRLGRSLRVRWAWADTCCVNQQDKRVLEESVVAMFEWYRGSFVTIVHLHGVPSELQEFGLLWKSIWNTRGWTYPEYVASKVVQFYTKDWKPYLGLDMFNHKESPRILEEMERATNISTEKLSSLQPGFDMAREKLYLASRRQTKYEEDIAYCLFGIFGVSLPIMYGEGDQAVGRLLEHILTRSDNATLLAWTGTSGSQYSYLPIDLTVYDQVIPPHIPLLIPEADMESMVAGLRTSVDDPPISVALYEQFHSLRPLSISAGRLRVPGIIFPLSNIVALPEPDSDTSFLVYHATTPMIGDVVITTRDDLSGKEGLILIHPWISPLLDQDFSLGVPLFDSSTRALRLIVRLMRPFGALLLAPSARTQYKRVATDSLIMVQIREGTPLTELMKGISTVDVQ